MRLLSLPLFALMACFAGPPDLPSEPPPDTLAGVKAVAQALASANVEDRLLVIATGARTEAGPVLRFTMTNVSREELRFYRWNLPWGNANALDLAVTTTRGADLPILWPLSDPPPSAPDEPLILKPGESWQGEYEVLQRVEGRPEQLNDGLLVTWVYTRRAEDDRSWRAANGVTYVPRDAAF